QQNYPNPFNPNTIIRFQIKDSRFVTLKVYDMLGKEVATLVNEKLAAGTYEATFDASQYTSGVYFYRLQTENFTDTKRMILIK
ncbi:MAG: T9SS type A sorting domain-containing protein, partial [Ignavibacteriae bacterium]|nr:T9SS type A sorting domain-containing protein [Ignavibacteriota bacterium]